MENNKNTLRTVILRPWMTERANRKRIKDEDIEALMIPKDFAEPVETNSFYWFVKLRRFEVEAGNPAFCAIDGVLYDKDVTTLIAIPKQMDSTVRIPASVVRIGLGEYPPLTDETLEMTHYEVEDGNTAFAAEDGVLFNQARTKLLKMPRRRGLTAYAIPDGVLAVGDYAFRLCVSLQEITFPPSLTAIGDWAFSGCIRLTRIDLPERLRSVGQAAFDSCTSLLTANLPTGPLELDKCVFQACDALKHIFIPAGVTRIGGDGFNCTHALERIDVAEDNPAYSTDEHGVLFNKDRTELYQMPEQSGIETYVVPDGVVTIADEALRGCKTLRTLMLPDSLRTIGDMAFQNCPLQTLDLPEEVTEIGDYFIRGTAIRALSIPAGCRTLGEHILDGCDTLRDLYVHVPDAWCLPVGPACLCDGSVNSEKIDSNHQVTLHIPAGSEKSYKWHPFFCQFEHVETFGEDTGDGTVRFIVPKQTTTLGTFEEFCRSYTFRCAEEMVIHAGVTKIEPYFLWECKSLREIVVEAGNPVYCAIDGMLFEKAGMRLMYVPRRYGRKTLVVPQGTKVIGCAAFFGLGFEEIILPDGLTGMEDGAFAFFKDGLRRLRLPASVAGITYRNLPQYDNEKNGRDEDEPLDDFYPGTYAPPPALEAIEVDAESPCYTSRDGILFSRDGTRLVRMPDGHPFEEYRVPDGVVAIEEGAFCGCLHLQSVTLPDSLCRLGAQAFRGCKELRSVTLAPSCSLSSIGEGTFEDCHALSAITLPDGVTEIGKKAFAGCKALCRVLLPESLHTIAPETFDGCTGLTEVHIPAALTLMERPFTGCSGLARISVDEANPAFLVRDGILYGKDGTSLLRVLPRAVGGTTYYILPGIVCIGDGAFSGCEQIETVVIPDTVTTIGRAAFERCTGLERLTIPDSVTAIGEWAFNGCSSLQHIRLPRNITDIGKGSFEDCDSLATVHIPQGVASIGAQAFSGCSHLREIVIPPSVRTIGNSAFLGTGLCDLLIPEGVKEIGRNAFGSCFYLESVTLPDGVKRIGDDAFSFSAVSDIYCLVRHPETIRFEDDLGDEGFLECDDPFDRYDQITLHVPAASLEAYRAHRVFGCFDEIRPIEDVERGGNCGTF